jgi:SLA1 homology domain 1, SHD1
MRLLWRAFASDDRFDWTTFLHRTSLLQFGRCDMKPICISLAVIVALSCLTHGAAARVWTDSTGHYSVEAELIAFNETTAVLQRADHELVAVPMEKLSAADREFVKSKEAKQLMEQAADELQTWTLRDGTRIVGRVIDYARRDLTLERRDGKIYVNDQEFEKLPVVYQRMVPKIVAQFEKIEPDKEGVTAWLVRQKGGPRSFGLEGVIMELESGDEYAIPFFFFSPEDLQVLRPGWNEWLAAHQQDDYREREDQSFLIRSLAAARQRDREVQREIAIMQLNLEAVQAGITSMWEVTLYPVRGNSGPPMWVVVPGRNSLQATNAALSQYPGYAAGPVRRVST